MKNDYVKMFDVPAFLALGDFNPWGVAASNLKLRADEYFFTLSKFMNMAPDVIEVLMRLTTREGDSADLKTLTQARGILANLGCKKLILQIDSVIDAGQKDNREFAFACAAKASDEFFGIYTRTMTVVKRQVPIEENYVAPRDGPILKEVLKQSNRDEAPQKPLVLVADDSLAVLQSVTMALGEYCSVYTLAKPGMLKLTLDKIKPDLFLIDYNMPEVNGLELIPIIRGLEAHRLTPIVFFTSESTRDLVSAALMHGVTDFIVKPIRPDLLWQRISKHLI